MRKKILLILLLVFSIGFSQTAKDYEEGNVEESKGFPYGPRSLADMPNVVNNPKQIERAGIELLDPYGALSNSGGVAPNTECNEENPNDFTFENGYPCSSISPYKVANDLTVAPDEDFTLTGMTVSIFANGGITDVVANYYSDASGRPGTLIGSGQATILGQTVIGSNFGIPVNELELDVPPFVFNGQVGVPTHYWVELLVTDIGITNNVYWVITSSSMVGRPTAQFDQNGWTIPDTSVDGVYTWKGTCEPLGGTGGVNYCAEENPNNFLFELGYRASATGANKVANDLTIAADGKFTLTHITASVFANSNITNVDVTYYADSAGLPGMVIGSQTSVNINSQTTIGSGFGYDAIELELEVNPFDFYGQAGTPTTYWIELSFTDVGATPDIYWIVNSTSSNGHATARFGRGSWSIVNPTYDGVYAWIGTCETTATGPSFPSPYCGPLNFTLNAEPITLVSMAGIDNRTDATIIGALGHEDFTAVEGTVVAGNSYPIVLEGNTAGLFENHFVVFIDWNQNGILDDAGEVYPISQTITGSTGTDGQQANGIIDVPVGALTGPTRMRVKKLSGLGNHLNPCLGTAYGQAEDYTLQVLSSHTDFVYENNVWTPVNPQGVCTSVDNIHIKNGSTTLTDNISANNITIDAGGTLSIEKVLTFAGDLVIDGNLVFVSNATGTGELGYVANSSTITGNATVQSYMSDKRSYRMVGSAVTTSTSIHDNWQEGAVSNIHDPNPGFGTHITGSITDQQNGFDGTATGNPSMFKVDVANQQFTAISNTNVNTLTAGEAYLLFVRGDRSIDLGNNKDSTATVLRATGALFTGTQIQSFPDADTNDFIMFGNPYQSAVDLNSVFANSTNLNTGHYYVYDPTMADHGAYITVILPSGINFSGSAANQYLQPGQGAQVMVSGTAPSVVFNESDKAPGQYTTTSRPFMNSAMLTAQLFTRSNFQSRGMPHDGFAILFDENHDNSVTSKDAVKPMNFYENLGIDNNGTHLSIAYREMPRPEEVYSLYTSGYQHTFYILKIDITGLENSIFYLNDHFTGDSVPLSVGDNTYAFTVDAGNADSVASDRFSIRVAERLGSDGHGLLSSIHLYPNPVHGNTFYINAPGLDGEMLDVSVSDLSGRRIFDRTLECRADTVTVPMGGTVSSGVYTVTLKHGGESQIYRLIKE